METDIYSEKLKSYAAKCIDKLNEFKADLYETIEKHDCVDEKIKCLSKIDVFEQGSEILKNIFNLKENEKSK